MKVSRKWLQKFFDTELPDSQTLADAIMFHAFEVEGVSRVGDDEVLELKVLQRGHDCLSHRGVAKELSAILKIPLAHDPFGKAPELSKNTNAVSVKIDSPLCSRYIAGYIKGVKVGLSPRWLRERLEAIGQRSINNVVDATNFVMFNTGQPLHAFDASRLGSLSIGVRLAREGEEMEALDKQKYTLHRSMLVITAGDRPVGIAGIKGGMADRIDEQTKDIILEAANFDGVSIRRSAQALKLRTDASTRFEQVLSPELCAYAVQQAADLISKIASGEVAGFVDVYPEPQQPMHISVALKKINRVLGTELTGAEVADVFQRLGFSYKEEHGVFTVVPPFERLDIAIPEDLVEEVGRIIGYDKIPARELPPFEKKPEINENFAAAEQAREKLQALGYGEIFTSVFAEKGEHAVANKIGGDKPYLRDSLLPGLQEALKKNLPNKDLLGLKEIKLFEIGTVWKSGKELTMLGTVSEKEEAREMPLEPVAVAAYENLPLSTATRFVQFSKYPYIVRDIALWVPAGTDQARVLGMIQKEAGALCVRAGLFDTFEKKGKLSLAFRLVFQSFDRTLTEAEVNKIMEKISAKLRKQSFEIR